MNKVKDNFSFMYAVIGLTKRNVLLFYQNKVRVLFSLLAPLLILTIYVLFLGKMQQDAVLSMIEEMGNFTLESREVRILVDSWMISGVLGVACLTVGLNSMLCMVSDKETNVIADFTSAPLRPVKVLLSYFFSGFIITFGLVFIVLIICITYLSFVSGYFFTLTEIFELILILILSTLSSVMLIAIIMSFFKAVSSCAAFTGIFSALVGFLIGAYLPLSMLPTGVQNLANLIPGSHSTGLFRQILLDRAIGNLSSSVPTEFVDYMKDTYGYNLELFGFTFDRSYMYIYLTVSIFLFFFTYLIIQHIRKEKGYRV